MNIRRFTNLTRPSLLALVGVLLVQFAFAQDLVELEERGRVRVQPNAIVEGSSRVGGIQPDYRVDLDNPVWEKVFTDVDKIKASGAPLWAKIEALLILLGTDIFKYVDYKNPYYRRLLKEYREKGEPVPLSGFLACGAGVCREHALVLHVLLDRAGIPNEYANARIRRASKWDDYDITEDHAFNIVKDGEKEWVVDAYYWGFNGFLLKDLMSNDGITEHSETAPVAAPRAGFRRIIEIHAFPRVWIAKPATQTSCQKLLNAG